MSMTRQLARVGSILLASVPPHIRERCVLASLIRASLLDAQWARDSVNKVLRKEFEAGGVVVPDNVNFFEIVHKAIASRARRGQPEYDDLFQDVMSSLLYNDQARVQWVRKAKVLQSAGRLDNFAGWLKTVVWNHVQDLHNAIVRKQKRHPQLKDPTDDEVGGIDLERWDRGESNQEDEYTAKDLFEEIKRNLKHPISRKILDILVDKGITGFLEGKGVVEVAEALGVTSSTVQQHYRDKVFKPDIIQALRKMGDDELLDRARGMPQMQKFFTAAHPALALVRELSEIRSNLHPA